ncbi:MAG: GNAT family N-acetyltransferase [Rhodospirillales bacterium]
MKARVLSSIHEADAAAWDACAGDQNPFVSHAFLAALEDSGAATAKTGWAAQHLVIEDEGAGGGEGGGGALAACAPLYLKNHSYGEYVFDWGWAEAYERAGGNYYPKLQCGVPFTPAAGPRLLRRTDAPGAPGALQGALAAAMVERARAVGASSAHITFLPEAEQKLAAAQGFMARSGVQYHWTNRGYRTFDDFLAALASRKRKAVKKERRAVADQGVKLQRLTGADIQDRHWAAFHRFYCDTTERKWGPAYLPEEFFPMLGARMADKVLLVIAEPESGGDPVAGALNLIGHDTLYGRNWGCLADYRFLHFEACYYQAIEHAIETGLARVEAGAQGEHKIQRGYLPERTFSAHWIGHPEFGSAVADFLRRENAAVGHEIEMLMSRSPYRQADDAR